MTTPRATPSAGRRCRSLPTTRKSAIPNPAPRRLLNVLPPGNASVAPSGDGELRLAAAPALFANLFDKVALYNFLSTFSGTHFLQPRTVIARVGLVF